MATICDVSNRNELAAFLGIKKQILTFLLYVQKVESYYSTFDIAKKNGGTRKICASNGILKKIQKRLANELAEHQKNILESKGIKRNISHAFEKNKNIITNARIHKNKRFVMNIDLEDFFSSFHFGRVLGYFEKNDYFRLPREVAVIIAQLSCYNGRLPQGSPCSPIITNLICQIIDNRLLKIAKHYKLDYTRYADDLTFSTNNTAFINTHKLFYKDVCEEIKKSGFTINNNKTRLQFKNSRQEVTGLIVNQKLNVNKKYRKATRAMVYELCTTGKFQINGTVGTMKQLEGRLAFIDYVDKYNNANDNQNEKHNRNELSSREKQYQLFLFYKYFFSNDKPLIITEGKTDIVYLKSALKKLYSDYPNLITKNKKGNFEYKISFLKRTKRLKYFFGISEDGADTMKNLYYYFVKGPKQKCNKYLYDLLFSLSNKKPTKQVVFLFDNELINKEKPLYKFIKAVNLVDDNKKNFAENLFVRLIPDRNVFLLTNQTVKEKTDAEIEDLFDAKTLRHVINGKKFSRDKNFENTTYYGKDHFSKYIAKNYKNINFDGFKVLLNKINTIIEL